MKNINDITVNNPIEMSLSEVDRAKAILKLNGYYVDNIWHIDDVKMLYSCTDGQAYEVLDDVLNQESLFLDVYTSIDQVAKDMDLKDRDEEL
jgi:hypothetical protein